MKKTLLLAAGAMLASMSAQADNLGPMTIPDYVITNISANGQWAVSSDELYYNFSIINLVTGETWDYGEFYGTEDTFSHGIGHSVSDNGIVVASGYDDGQPCYWVDGEWHALPIKPTDWAAYPNAITPDGSRIAGVIMKSAMTADSDKIMAVPAVWDRKSDGTYGMYTTVAYPTKDITGRTPQYILVDDISADGTVLACDMVDYSGFMQLPLVITQGADGAWSYEFLHPELTNPNGTVFPEDPGEAPEAPNPTDFMSSSAKFLYTMAKNEYENRVYPEEFDFMTEEEIQAYQEAYDLYLEDWEANPYPTPEQFMTEEEYNSYLDALDNYYNTPEPDPLVFMSESEQALYQAAMDAYQVEYDAWSEAFNAFEDALWDVMGNPDAVAFSMNSALVSPNGRYYLMSGEMLVENPESWTGFSTVMAPYIFDLAEGTVNPMDKGQTDIIATMVTDEGYVLGASPSDGYSRNSFIAQGKDADFAPLADYIKAKDAELGEWIDANCTHDVINYDYVWNEDIEEYEEVITTESKLLLGTPVASADLKVFASWIYNNWETMPLSVFYSYIMPIKDGQDGIATIATKSQTIGVAVDRGVITLTGDVANLKIYDISGREIYSIDSPASKLTTPVAGGAYVIKATATDGTTATRKAIF